MPLFQNEASYKAFSDARSPDRGVSYENDPVVEYVFILMVSIA